MSHEILIYLTKTCGGAPHGSYDWSITVMQSKYHLYIKEVAIKPTEK